MTEEEAKTKWCPMARYVFNYRDYASGNRFEKGLIDGNHPCKCLGTGCMMWVGEKVGKCGLVLDESWVHVQNHY